MYEMGHSTPTSGAVKPRIIIHGGAGNITRDNIPPVKLKAYRVSLLSILHISTTLLSKPDAQALDVAVHAVSLLEDDPLFNCGKGAVFTRAGTNELESSVMVSNGYRKRGVGCMLLRKVKNPIKLAKEMLVRGEELDGGGAAGHCQLSGDELESLAEKWGLELVDPEYFWTKERWDQHKRGLERERKYPSSTSTMPAEEGSGQGDPSWDSNEFVPQGTVGAVVIDSSGTIAVATSTGGLTNKLSGRIGDTPTLGAGFWAEEWTGEYSAPSMICRRPTQSLGFLNNLSRGNIAQLIGQCFPTANGGEEPFPTSKETRPPRHAVGLSGTGNGDSFLKIAAVRSAAAICRFSVPNRSLSDAITRIAGPGGELQRSAGDRWGKSGEGEAGIIGIELIGDKVRLALDFNRGMFRAYVDDDGKAIFGAFRSGD